MPNKFFEYIQARIVPAIGPSPEMARIAREWDCGIVADDYTPEALAAAIGGRLERRLAELKGNCRSGGSRALRGAQSGRGARGRERGAGCTDEAPRGSPS